RPQRGSDRGGQWSRGSEVDAGTDGHAASGTAARQRRARRVASSSGFRSVDRDGVEAHRRKESGIALSLPHGSGKVLGGRSRFAIHSMLLGSLPSVSMNSLTAIQAFLKGINSPTGKTVSCIVRTCSPNRAKSPLEL